MSAIAHWGPRFVANGVTAPDFARITDGLTRWDDWCAAWSAVAAEHEALGRSALSARSAGEHFARAAVYYHFAKFVFTDDPAQAREAHRHAVECLNTALPLLTPPGRRISIPFEGTALAGVLRVPAPGAPCVILLSGLDSAKEELRATEDTLLVRGLATFTVDGPGQGEAEYALPIRGDWSAPGLAIADALAHVPDVNTALLGVWGVSLGGYYAPRVAAALGDRVRACVALAGPYDFGECWDGLPPLTRETFRVRSWTSSDAEARAVADTLTLAGQTSRITAPLLVVFGRQDRLIPWQHAQRLVDEVPGAELLMLEDGNHGCANRTPWHRPYTADWLAARLNALRPTAADGVHWRQTHE
ncbi:alpha/beta hydrolase family protein [Cryptosporangium aurantiacum]|uniref:alpha/beta hydrolase family protein n=1 Tax=Cryptosporangium aurantiacum TaxID=134849 RepID=UPI001C49E841|nr:YqiA/YcfP family alpha/beta fold hydrolase [Cryptosporangium aurantiacum]